MSDDRCMASRQMPGSFNEMVRAIYDAGCKETANQIIFIADDLIESGYDDEIGMLTHMKDNIRDLMEEENERL